MRARIVFLVAGSLLLAAPACRPGRTPTPETAAIDTAVAQTVQARLAEEAPSNTPVAGATDTDSPDPSPTPEPTETPRTTTELPTNTATPVPTTVPPTDTLIPTQAPATGTSVIPTAAPATNTPAPTSAPATATPAPVTATAEPPTETPTQVPTAPAPPAPPPAVCSLPVAPQFSARLEAAPDILIALGCPIEPVRETWAAEQRFQFGGMLWQQDLNVIHIVYGNGTYELVVDQWEEGDPDYLCPEQGPAPTGLVMPKRGFGWHWCAAPAVRAGLGWALEEEQGYQATWQDFERGHLQLNRENVLFVFFDDGTWDTVG